MRKIMILLDTGWHPRIVFLVSLLTRDATPLTVCSPLRCRAECVLPLGVLLHYSYIWLAEAKDVQSVFSHLVWVSFCSYIPCADRDDVSPTSDVCFPTSCTLFASILVNVGWRGQC